MVGIGPGCYRLSGDRLAGLLIVEIVRNYYLLYANIADRQAQLVRSLPFPANA
jgi:hypothetical protein